MEAVAYLVVANPSAKNNLGTLIRCAAAFAVEEVVVVGASKWSTHGAHGSNKHVRYRCFDDWETAATFLKAERGCDLCGIVAQGRPSPPGSSPPPPGDVGPASPAKAGSPGDAASSTAVAGNAHHGVKSTESSGTASVGVMPACPESGKKPPVDQCPTDPGADKPDNRSSPSSSPTPPPSPSPFLQPLNEGGREATEGPRDHKKNNNNDSSSTAASSTKASTAVRRRPFRRSTAFLVGYRNRLEDEALNVCDFLVHVEQASELLMELNAPVTTSIALHHFTAWARYEEREFSGEKFNVDKDAARRRCLPPTQEEEVKRNPLAEERVRLREELRASDPLDHDGNEDGACGGGLGWLEGMVGDENGESQGDYR